LQIQAILEVSPNHPDSAYQKQSIKAYQNKHTEIPAKTSLNT
jgi:hypothetical protein